MIELSKTAEECLVRIYLRILYSVRFHSQVIKGEQVRIELESGNLPGHNWVLVEPNQADPSARDKAIVQARRPPHKSLDKHLSKFYRTHMEA